MDDLTALEVISLLNIGLSSYNFKQHVPSDVPENGYFMDSKNLKSQSHLDQINQWTNNQKMKLNTTKTKAMLINFTRKHQFTTRLKLDNVNLELVDSMKILGTIIENDLSWNENTDNIIKRVNKRMLLIKKIHSFGASTRDMVFLWTLYCRSILEQSAIVWSSSLTKQNKNDLERTQKSFAKLILKNKYTSYEEALEKLNLQSLEERREELSLKFAKVCTKSDKFRKLFPENQQERTTRNTEKYHIEMSNTERTQKSSIFYMRNQLNIDKRTQNETQ